MPKMAVENFDLYQIRLILVVILKFKPISSKTINQASLFFPPANHRRCHTVAEDIGSTPPHIQDLVDAEQ